MQQHPKSTILKKLIGDLAYQFRNYRAPDEFTTIHLIKFHSFSSLIVMFCPKTNHYQMNSVGMLEVFVSIVRLIFIL